MKNFSPKFTYFAQINKNTDSGVLNKINGITQAAKKIGYDSNYAIVEEPGIRGAIELLRTIITSNCDTSIIRSIGPYMLILAPGILFMRLKKKYVAIDIPTPISTSILESRSRVRNPIKMWVFEFLIRASFPISLLPANKIIQYSAESKFFQFGVRKKSILTANGINTASIKNRKIIPTENENFVFIGVANIANWHGYDRLIKSISNYTSDKNNNIRIRFIIAGNGPEKSNLENITKLLNLEKNIEFVGKKNAEELNILYEKSHIAVGSLALHRKNLNIASELKLREYTATGIPFISASNDIDFQDNPDFIYKIKSDESDINISHIIKWYRKLNFNSLKSNSLHEYAEKKLDFSAKIFELIPKPRMQ